MNNNDRFLGIVDEPKRKQTWTKRLKSLVCIDRKGLKKPPSTISPVLIERSVMEEEEEAYKRTPSPIEWMPVKDPRMPSTPPITPPPKERSESGDWSSPPMCGICLG